MWDLISMMAQVIFLWLSFLFVPHILLQFSRYWPRTIFNSFTLCLNSELIYSCWKDALHSEFSSCFFPPLNWLVSCNQSHPAQTQFTEYLHETSYATHLSFSCFFVYHFFSYWQQCIFGSIENEWSFWIKVFTLGQTSSKNHQTSFHSSDRLAQNTQPSSHHEPHSPFFRAIILPFFWWKCSPSLILDLTMRSGENSSADLMASMTSRATLIQIHPVKIFYQHLNCYRITVYSQEHGRNGETPEQAGPYKCFSDDVHHVIDRAAVKSKTRINED